jgi:RHH-type proline utilization regulon transcriptional repressor/proline dehydrogenase/delta 1-pyrroline-5-carboxylate dehydrogenase
MPVLMGLLVREAGKSLPNAVGEVREAVDFLRYYAAEAAHTLAKGKPLGPVACISPWNFPLAIFMGQVAAALAAGNVVLAKPAEETPLIAAEAVRLLHAAGIPEAVVQLVLGDGAVGAALVADARVQGVVFTGSTAVARAIQRQLAGRLTRDGMPVPLIAETGGQNALVVDSSALPEQVVGDVIASAFDSAGQRCSALRILCLQEDSAERTLSMLKGAMRELAIGNPDRLEVDVGPVISAEALAGLQDHVAAMRARGFSVEVLPLPEAAQHGTFMAPTLIEIGAVDDVEREVFGPVLHVLRFRRERLDALIDAINATGYALTFGLHTRIDETVARVTKRVTAGNIYVNRNIIGAVVGAQPFGGSGLSGTGPKAGGPLYLRRLLAAAPPVSIGGTVTLLPGPAGEDNVYRLEPRGLIAALSSTEAALREQIEAIRATGNIVLVERSHPALGALPPEVMVVDDWLGVREVRGALFDGDRAALLALTARVAERPGPILMVQARGAEGYRPEWLVEEVSVSTNTAAAGGNASLMAMA